MKKPGFNQTVYRIIKLMQWMSCQPLSQEQINECFLADPMIQRSVSQDTIGLYMNTLRAVGCQVERPKPSNNYCYTLSYHPFSYCLDEETLQFLFQLVQYVDDTMGCRDMLHRQQFVWRVIEGSANTNRKALKQQFLDRLRIRNLDQLQTTVAELESHCHLPCVLEVAYQSPNKSRVVRYVLPEKLMCWNDTIYLKCYMLDYDGCVMLRVDRIDEVRVVDHAQAQQMLAELCQKQSQQEEVWVRFINCYASDLNMLDYLDVADVTVDPTDEAHCLVKFCTSNLFFLKQALLESGYRFQVIYPDGFRQEMRTFLVETQARYAG
ncbi:MAG: WYL domain-containing protein [Cyanobacteria bacterium HKST-UBA04]|nr:WYL domain-containing protein [Cyanobacteria bacterium HKST-UBA04]